MIGDIFQPTHLLFVLVVALLVLGPKRLPEAGRALGRGIRDFRMAISGDDQDRAAVPSETTDVTPPAPAVAPPGTETAAHAPEASPPAAETPPPADTATQPTEPAQPVG
jgi:sec-independent protein translocase protein TatA